MSKGDTRRPESEKGSFGRGWERIRWSDGSVPVRYQLVSEDEWKPAPGTLLDVFTKESNG